MKLRPTRMNTGPDSKYLDELALNAYIEVDGVAYKYIFLADTDKGYIVVDVVDDKGKLKWDRSTGLVARRAIHGKVTILDKRTGKYVG